MYAFYSLLVYIFYTVFKKEDEEEGALEVCVDTFNKSGVGGSCWSGRSNSIHFYFICTRLGPFKNKMVFKEAACIYHAFIQHWMPGYRCVCCVFLPCCGVCSVKVNIFIMYHCLALMP